MSTVAVNLVFSALADSTRRHVLERLAVSGAASASTLARELPVSRQAIVKHMSVLEDAGLVSRKKKRSRDRVQCRGTAAGSNRALDAAYGGTLGPRSNRLRVNRPSCAAA